MTGGLWEEQPWVPVPGRVASTINITQHAHPLANNNTTTQIPELNERGGDGGDPWVLVLLGKEGSGKSSTGNSILGTQALTRERHEDVEVVNGVIPSIEVPVKILETIGYGRDRERNTQNFNTVLNTLIDMSGKERREERGERHISLMNLNILREQIHLVHAFLLVVNAEDLDQQPTFDVLRDYVNVFGNAILANLVIVVTHWSMSEGANKIRQDNNVSREKFTETWIDTLGQNISLQSSNDMIPFVFLDNMVGMLGESAHSAFDETERECFEVSKCAIFQHLSACPVFMCKELTESELVSKGYKKCSQCFRYFIPVDQRALTDKSSGLACASQASVAAARIARVAQATSRAWTPQAAIKAMTRGWGRGGGVHLFGKVVARAGLAVQVGFGVYRFVSATSGVEKAKAAIGTGAGIVGGWGGATWGATVGTFLLPGVGTVLGGIVGGLAGAVGLQMASEKCIDLFAPDVCFSCKKYEM